MKRALTLASLLAAAALVMAARPASEFDLLTRLNGVPYRWVQADGGRSVLSTQYDAGVLNSRACTALSGTDQRGAAFTPTVLMLVPEVPMNVCIRPIVTPNGVTQPWDGGCNGAEADENFGTAVQPWAPYYVVLQSQNTTICGASDSGYLQGALFDMR